MKPVFVKTQNFRAFEDALLSMSERGAEECQLIVVDGEPGLGKTTILSKWAAENACLYLRAKTEWNPSWFMGELLDEVRVQQPHRHEARFKAALQALAERAVLAEQTGRQFAVVIDEADISQFRVNFCIFQRTRTFIRLKDYWRWRIPFPVGAKMPACEAVHFYYR